MTHMHYTLYLQNYKKYGRCMIGSSMNMRIVVLGIYEYIIHAYLSVHNKVFFYVWQKGNFLPQNNGTTKNNYSSKSLYWYECMTDG